MKSIDKLIRDFSNGKKVKLNGLTYIKGVNEHIFRLALDKIKK